MISRVKSKLEVWEAIGSWAWPASAPTVLAYLRSLDPRLPRSVWIMEAGGLVNAFGNGITFPFLVIYLHNVRGFSLATAGLVVAAGNAIGLLAGPVAG